MINEKLFQYHSFKILALLSLYILLPLLHFYTNVYIMLSNDQATLPRNLGIASLLFALFKYQFVKLIAEFWRIAF
jgi:hypothetical protein